MREHPVPESAADPPAGAGERASLARWKELIRRANDSFGKLHYGDALRGYRQGLRVAEGLVAGPGLAATPDDCLAALVVSHHNLADVHRLRGHLDAAIEHLCQPHRALAGIAANQAAPEHVRLAALRHLRETRFALLDWQQRYGACAATDALLKENLVPVALSGGGRLH